MGVVSVVVAASDSSKSARQHPSLTRGTPLGQAFEHPPFLYGRASSTWSPVFLQPGKGGIFESDDDEL